MQCFSWRLLKIISVRWSIALTILLPLPSTSLALPSKPLQTITIAQFGKEKFLLYLPLYVAMEERLFEKRGLSIRLQFAGNDDQIFASVIRGDALFGVGDPAFVAISRERGGPGKVVALLVEKLGLSGVSRKGGVPFVRDPHQLKGLRMSSFPEPSTTFTLLSQIINRHQLKKFGTTIVQTAIGTQIAALEAEQVDIALDLEPAISIAESKGYELSFLLDNFTVPQAITGLTTLEKTILEQGDLVQKVVSSLHEALEIINDDNHVALRVATTLFPHLSREVIERSVSRMLSFGVYPKSSRVPDELWQTTLRTRLASGDLKALQETSFAVDNSFASTAEGESLSREKNQ